MLVFGRGSKGFITLSEEAGETAFAQCFITLSEEGNEERLFLKFVILISAHGDTYTT